MLTILVHKVILSKGLCALIVAMKTLMFHIIGENITYFGLYNSFMAS